MTPILVTEELLKEHGFRALWLWEGKLEASLGSDVGRACKELVYLAALTDSPQTIDFNGVSITAAKDDNPQVLRDAWQAEMDVCHAAYLASPEYAESQRKAEEAARAKVAAFAELIVKAPAEPTWAHPDKWQDWVDANKDGYGGTCVSFARTWARLMEAAIAEGETVAECAERLSHVADQEGITGSMYGGAVSMLSQYWAHGEELRRWHNLDMQIGNEGEKANESGGVLNPALLSVGA